MLVERTSASQPFRIAVLNSHPIQYFAPLYAYLNGSEEFDLTVFYCSDFSLRGAKDKGFEESVVWDVDLLSGYKAVFLGDRAKMRTPAGFWSLVCPEVWQAVGAGHFDVLIVHGHNYAANVFAILAAKTAGIPVFMRGDTNNALKRSSLLSSFICSFKRSLYGITDGCLAVGSANRDFYRSLGISDLRITLVPFAVDNDRFIAKSASGRARRAEILSGFGLSLDQPVVLFVSKLQRLKRPDDLIRAVTILNRRGYEPSLLMAGAGEMKAELEQLTRTEGLSNVVFAGFLNQSILPEVFGASDIFVLPSENDQWGLVVNEAMCAELPVVVAEGVGCVPDLVHDGENGLVFKAGDVEGLAHALETLLIDEDKRRRMGRRSLEMIQHWSFAECRTGLLKALEARTVGRH
jgi:glycosyltransferase involved in cell wall biosynthesis